MGKRTLFKTGLTYLTAAIGMGITGCVPYDGTPLETREPILDNGVLLNGTAGGSCAVPPSTLNTDGRYLKASYSEAACAKLRVCLDPNAWKNLPQSTYIPGIDIVILFDATGSMTPYIKAMIQNIEQLMDNLSTMSPSVRIGLASFRDFPGYGGSKGDKPYIMNTPLTASVSQVKSALSSLKASGGGDIAESLATAIRATIDGKGMKGYFDPSDIGWSDDASRIKIVLGVTDAANKEAKNLPAGAPTLEEAAKAMKEKGILFVGIGRGGSVASAPRGESTRSESSKEREHEDDHEDGDDSHGDDHEGEHDEHSTAPAPTPTALPTASPDGTSYNDLAYLANFTNAIAAAPGVDLDGDGKTTTYGEVKTGDPAVLRMTSSGNLEGAPKSSNPTRVLADAIAQMVKRIRPFQFALNINGNGRNFAPSTNILAVPANTTTEACFSQVSIDPKSVAPNTCAGAGDVVISSDEESSSSHVDSSMMRAEIQIDLSCITGSNPTPAPTAEPSPAPTPTVDPSPAPTPPSQCTGVGCDGGVIGV